MNMFIIILLMMSILISSVSGEENQSINNATYRVYVDQYHGFYAVYQVYNVTSAKVILYENNTLNISRGDKIIWSNEAVPDAKLTITSKENLWDKYNGTLKWSYKQFTYTFNKSGIYEMYVREYPRFKQKIIVDPLDDTNITITNKTINRVNSSNIERSNVDNTNKTATNMSTKNSTEPVTTPEKKQGTEVAVLITVTLSLIYIFDRKIK